MEFNRTGQSYCVLIWTVSAAPPVKNGGGFKYNLAHFRPDQKGSDPCDPVGRFLGRLFSLVVARLPYLKAWAFWSTAAGPALPE
jgi:hypothetical protein